MLQSNCHRLLLLIGLAGVSFLWFWTDPTPKIRGTVKIYDRRGQLLYESSASLGHQEWVPLETIPNDLKQAVVLVEDSRFWHHRGLDLQAMIRAMVQNIQAGQIISGASTIPQQVARYTVISPQTPAKISWIRKIREVLMAIRLSLATPKEKILERYLNTIYFGRQAYGVQSASRLYFGKEVSQLSLAQTALLSGMVANPSVFDPITNPAPTLKRRNQILSEMNRQGYLDNERYERACQEPLPQQTFESPFLAPHAVEMALQEVKDLGLLSNLGIAVTTTVDAGWYELTRSIAGQHVNQLKDKHDLTNAAVVIIENTTGQILTILGSINYFDDSIQGKNNMALALRQPGSTLKPVTYATAFQNGIATPATLIEDLPKVYLTKEDEGFIPHNYDGRYRGPVLVREALASSYNLPAVEMLSRVGVESFLSLAYDMGITSMQETARYGLALTLGGGEISLLELTNLYATFARGGRWLSTQLVTQVQTDDQKILYESPNPEAQRALDERVAWLISHILSDSKARLPTFGEKNPLVLSQPAAVKTGTTTDWHDNWTVGYTPTYTVGVWVGNADNHPMRDITGVTGAAPIWNQVFEEILKFEPRVEFVRPEGIIGVEVCSWDGLLPTEACSERYLEMFIQGTEPSSHTNLMEKPKYGQAGNKMQIISPRVGTVYEIGSEGLETIVFETTPSAAVERVIWKLDGQNLTPDDCHHSPPSACFWTPELGDHTLNARTITKEGLEINLMPVRFSVVEYREDW